MKNLQIKNLSQLTFHEDSLQQSIITYCNQTQQIFEFRNEILKIFKYNEFLNELESEEEINISSLGLINPQYMCHQIFYDKLIIITNTGQICTVHTENLDFGLIKPFNKEIKIIDIKMSPNQEQLVILTNKGELVILNKMLEIEKTYSLSEQNDFNILNGCITWRFDSEYFNLIYQINQGCKIITFSKHLQQFVSPSQEHEEYPLVINYSIKYYQELIPLNQWSSNGSQIALVEIKNSKKNIIFIEKNVLHYEQFEINQEFQNYEIEELFWHPQETILFIKMKNQDQNVYVIYQKSNGRWSLKQVIQFQEIVVFQQFQKNQLIVFLNKGQVFKITFQYEVNLYNYQHDEQISNGLGIQIQDNKLSLTPYDKFKIPSPMSLTHIEHNLCIKDFYFFKNQIYYIDTNNDLYYAQYDFPDIISEPKLLTNLKKYFFIRDLRVINYEDNQRVLFLHNNKEEEYKLELIYFDIINEKVDEFQVLEFQEDQDIDSIKINQNIVYFLVNRNSIYFLNFDINDIEHQQDLELENHEYVKDWMILQKLNQQEEQQSDQENNNLLEIIFLNQNDTLFIDDRKISEDVTSFLIYKQHFLFTTHTNTPYDHLYLISLESLLQNNFERPNPNTSSSVKNFRKRNVEKNSYLICCSDTQILFYLPRGNFEGIHHRILLIEKVYKLVQQKLYLKAFLLIRKNKLNSNLLVDIDIEQFIEYLENNLIQEFGSKFCDQFIMDLTNNFSEELSYILSEQIVEEKRKIVKEKIQNQNKINYVLKFFEEKYKNNQDLYIMNLMAVYAKMSPPALQKGLELIKEIKDQDSSLNQFRSQPPHQHQKLKKIKTYKDILQYFSWLADAEQLYRLSLSIYDLDLALMVAEFTQKDPKEYLVFINDLKDTQNEIDFKYKIHFFLKNYSECCQILSKGDQNQINQALDMIQEYKIFIDGIKIFENTQYKEQIQKFLGKFLMSQKDYKNAVFILSNFEDTQKEVLICYEKILDYQGLLNYDKRFKIDQTKKQQILDHIQKQYQKTKSYSLLCKFFKSQGQLDLSIVYALKNFDYKKAKNLLQKYPEQKKNSEIEKNIQLQYYEELNKSNKKCNDYENWKERLEFVQQRKQNLIMQGIEDDNLSMLTDLTSMQGTEQSSNISVITGLKTGIRRNKKPRNLHQRRYKENSVYEEEWLVESLNIVIDIKEEDEKNLGNLFNILLDFNKIKELKELYESLNNLITIVKNQKKFEQKNIEVYEIYSHLPDFDQKIINSQKERKFDNLKKFEKFINQLQKNDINYVYHRFPRKCYLVTQFK